MKEILVKKRNGDFVPLNIKKIQSKTKKATEGIPGVSAEELEASMRIQFYSGISTKEIQEILVKTAAEKIDVDCPNWTFVAARGFLEDLYHDVGKLFGGTKGNPYSHHLRDYLEYGSKVGRINESFWRDGFDLDELNDYIDPEKDKLFTYLGIKVFYDRYLLKDPDGRPFELPQHLFMAVAMFLAQNEEDKNYWAKRFYDIISKFEVMVATPTLSNARTNRNQLSSCYQGSTDDSIEGIFDAYKDMALLSKYGGGLGWDWTNVRAALSSIDGHKGAAGGIIPFLKVTNDIAIAVDQLGTRKGAVAVYLEPWHMDVLDFIDLKKNSGEERRRAHDLFPGLWIPDLFFKRVSEDGEWTLFDPFEVPDLHYLYGEEFEKRYIEYENDPSKRKEKISAKDLWKRVLLSYFETGSPFLGFKDEANRRHQNEHIGKILATNLCTEIFQATSPNRYGVEIEFEDGTAKVFEKEQLLEIRGYSRPKQAQKVTSVDRVYIPDEDVYKKVSFVRKVVIERGRTLVCNLASVNLSKVNSEEDIARVVPIAIRMLDNIIDINYYPVKNTKEANEESRAIGLGVMGEAQMLAEKGIHYGSEKHLETIDEIMESISYYAIKTSAQLAQEKGAYPAFRGSMWEKGILPIDSANKKALGLVSRLHSKNWDEIREMVKMGMRNGYLMAIAPTSSISIITGTTSSTEPVYKRKWYEENMSGLIPVTAPNISADTWEYYKPVYDMDQHDIVRAAAVRQKWIDQGQSVNIYIDVSDPSKSRGSYLNSVYISAWEYGLKSTYYLRSKSPEEKKEKDVVDRSIECEGCQ